MNGMQVISIKVNTNKCQFNLGAHKLLTMPSSIKLCSVVPLMAGSNVATLQLTNIGLMFIFD